MSYRVAASKYDRFMGRYSVPLAPRFAEFTGVKAGHVLDLGCGTGALTSVMVRQADKVSAVEPWPPFVRATRERFPQVLVLQGSAEDLPFPDDFFDAAVAQLVVHFMTNPVRGLAQMARATVPGGIVAASVWDHAGGAGPMTPFWNAVLDLNPELEGDTDTPGSVEGQLTGFFEEAGILEVEEVGIEVQVRFDTFDEWWEPYTLGVGAAGVHVADLEEEAREELREHCRNFLPRAPFAVTATSWAARGIVPE